MEPFLVEIRNKLEGTLVQEHLFKLGLRWMWFDQPHQVRYPQEKYFLYVEERGISWDYLKEKICELSVQNVLKLKNLNDVPN
jgi:hypothetical protein